MALSATSSLKSQPCHMPALHQNAIQNIQCKLILLRIAELPHHHTDAHFQTVFSHLNKTFNQITTASKNGRKGIQLDPHYANLSPTLINLNATLRRVKRYALLTLAFALRSGNGDPLVERVILRHRVSSFLAARPYPHAVFRRAAKHELAHLLHAFDQAVVNVFWHDRMPIVHSLPSHVRLACLSMLLPRFLVTLPLPEDMQQCAICCDSFKSGSFATRFSTCNHPFHMECLNT